MIHNSSDCIRLLCWPDKSGLKRKMDTRIITFTYCFILIVGLLFIIGIILQTSQCKRANTVSKMEILTKIPFISYFGTAFMKGCVHVYVHTYLRVDLSSIIHQWALMPLRYGVLRSMKSSKLDCIIKQFIYHLVIQFWMIDPFITVY